MVKDKIIEIVAAIAVISVALILLASITSCSSQPYLVGYSSKHLVEVAGEPELKNGDQWYWCTEGVHGYKRLMTTKIEKGVILESMQFRYSYSGECGVLVREWADRMERW